MMASKMHVMIKWFYEINNVELSLSLCGCCKKAFPPKELLKGSYISVSVIFNASYELYLCYFQAERNQTGSLQSEHGRLERFASTLFWRSGTKFSRRSIGGPALVCMKASEVAIINNEVSFTQITPNAD